MGPDLLLIGGLQPPRALVSISNMLCMFGVRYLVVSKLRLLTPNTSTQQWLLPLLAYTPSR